MSQMFSSRFDRAVINSARKFSQTVLPLDSIGRAPFRSAGVALRYARNARDLRQAIARYDRKPPKGDLEGKRIVLFAYQRHWLETVTAIAIALASRGARPTIAWLPHFADVPFAPSLSKGLTGFVRQSLRYAFSGSGYIRGLDLSSLRPVTIDAEVAASMDRVAKFDTHYLTRREALPLEQSSSDSNLRQFRTQRDRDGYSLALAALTEHRFDAAIIPNGSIFEFAAFTQACRRAKVPFSTFEFWERHNQCAFNLDRHFFDGFEKIFWSNTPKTLTAPMRDRVARSMAAREGTDLKDFVIRFQTAESKTAASLRADLRLDESKPTVLILPNVPYDTSILGTPGPFESMGDWLIATSNALSARSDCNVVIRAHPAEGVLGARETAAEIIRSRFPKLPPHFRFVESTAPINTYALMRITDLGMVYSSTTGLELAMRSVPTLVATKIHYAEKGFTLQMENEAGLAAQIDNVMRELKPLDQPATDLAWIYADMFMNRWPRPFPFLLQDPFWPQAFLALDSFWDDTAQESMQDTLTLLAGGPRAYALIEKLAADPTLVSTVD